MAKPRVFISSTYYDLKHIRADIDRFIKDQGFEPVLNEKGNIPYGSEKRLEEYCYKEIELCDILVAVIGGRFGSESKEADYSISNIELKSAIEKNKQVYIFIEKSVAAEYRTYEANKGNAEIRFAAADDSRVYKFIEEVSSLPINNQIQHFESAQEITLYLKEQWAGLFQRLLSESARQKEVNIIEDLKNTSKTLNQLVSYLINEKSRGDQAIKDILFSNHPAFEDIRRKVDIPYRVIFQNIEELNQLLSARQFEIGEEFDSWTKKGFISWKRKKELTFLRVAQEIFDEDRRLKSYTPSEWRTDWIELEEDFDIPF